MSYKPQVQLYNVTFSDKPGLEILCKGTKIGKLLQLQDLKLNLNETDEKKKLTAFKYFAGRIVQWNMLHPDIDDEEDIAEAGHCVLCGQMPGEPMTPSVQSLMCLEMSEVMGIVFGYMSVVARPSLPKDDSLSDGENRIREEAMRQLGEMQNLTTLPVPNFS